jgi:putative RNA 2'-phosphotransferase
MSDLKSTSKYISLILRHKPEVIGITLDDHGWADTQTLIEGVNRTHPLTMELLEEIVRTDEKQRYSFNADKSRIRANQGHSIPIDADLAKTKPPETLYHGTGEKSVASIERDGLRPMSRLYVHLSPDTETARSVGSRHGKPVIYIVLAGEMYRSGYRFYRSANGDWLTKEVPVRFLKRI